MKIFHQLLFMVVCSTTAYGKISFDMPKNNFILLGTIQLSQIVKNTLDFMLLYKGHEYTARIENSGDIAHFELYDTEKPTSLYILVSEYLSLPTSTEINYLKTSPTHPYRIFKLTLKRTMINKDDAIDYMYSWNVEEFDNTLACQKIPDSCIILFFDPALIESIEPAEVGNTNSIFHLPTIVIKKTPHIQLVADKMGCASIDFRLLHKKSHLAFVPYTNNRILSMPYTQHMRVRI